MADILKEICDRIRMDKNAEFTAFDPSVYSLAERQAPVPLETLINGPFFIIAECKKASPSRGVMKEDYHPAELASEYEKAGAGAVSVLTETNYFLGSPGDLTQVRKAVSIPVLRKDFILHPLQIYEAWNMGADFILLIAACLTDREMKELRETASLLGLGVLMEIHNREELDRALPLKPELLGINNRNLKTFITDLNTSIKLKPFIPLNQPVISESGIKGREDISQLKKAGFAGALVGESIVSRENPADKIRELLGGRT